MLSEKTYWVILIVAFSGFALAIWFWLIPYGVIEYNLGVNLFTSSIFMVITVFFLSWLFDLREKLQWKIVEERVYSRIALNLRSILTLIIFFIEMKDMKQEKPFRNLGDYITARLEHLNEQDSIVIDEKGRKTLLDKRYKIDLETRRRDLTEIEMKYSKFFTPKIVSSLLEIENCLLDLELHIKNLRYPPISYEGYEEMILGFISQKFHKIIKEIYKLHTMGIRIPPNANLDLTIEMWKS